MCIILSFCDCKSIQNPSVIQRLVVDTAPKGIYFLQFAEFVKALDIDNQAILLADKTA
jgi:hypothetical protein